MQEISGPAARAVLEDPRFVVPPVPAAATGVAWLRATVGRFSAGHAHKRRRALSVAILDAIPPDTLRGGGREHPVAVLARAMGIGAPVADLVREVAQAYQPGTGDEARADPALDRLVEILAAGHDEHGGDGERAGQDECGYDERGGYDEPTAARIGVLVQACEATATLIDKARKRPLEEVLRDDPPVPATKRQALVPVTVGGVAIGAGEVVRVLLAEGLAFGAGPRRCPGRAHALALAAQEEQAAEQS
jgi:hypothetical protein